MTRLKPHVIDHIQSPFHSERSSPYTNKPVAIVIHSTESHNTPGDSDLRAVAGWFQNPDAQVSSHVIVDGDGHSIRCVADKDKAWHCAGFNSPTLGIEQIGLASYSLTDWKKYIAECNETARWIAAWSIHWNIPIKRATVSGTSITPGVTMHKSLGEYGGNHDDPGTGYPFNLVLRRARHFKKLRLAS